MKTKHPTIYNDIFYSTGRVRKLMSAPFIYGMIVPMVFLDITMEVYHRVSFAIYKLPYVTRSHYIFLDRHKLSQLRWMQKLNCLYCGYVNGLLAYGVKIASETEKYWCSIKHENPKSLETLPHHKDFIDRSEFA